MNTYNIPNYHGVEVQYLPPTNTQGSRVKLTSHRLKESKTIAYDYSRSTALEIACVYLGQHKNTHRIIGQVATKKGFMLIIEDVDGTFQSIK